MLKFAGALDVYERLYEHDLGLRLPESDDSLGANELPERCWRGVLHTAQQSIDKKTQMTAPYATETFLQSAGNSRC